MLSLKDIIYNVAELKKNIFSQVCVLDVRHHGARMSELRKITLATSEATPSLLCFLTAVTNQQGYTLCSAQIETVTR